MIRRYKPRMITDLDRFAADLEEMAKRLNAWSTNLHTGSPHYWPIVDLSVKVIDTMRTVAGREPLWMQPLTPPHPPRQGEPAADPAGLSPPPGQK